MRIKSIRKFNIKVINSNNEVLYEGDAENAPENIKNLEYNEVVELNSWLMTLKV